MNLDPGHLDCAVCHKLADVWCPKDEAYLCNVCDEEVHSASSLAGSHTRTVLPGLTDFQAAPAASVADGSLPAPPAWHRSTHQQVSVVRHDCRDSSANSAHPVPDVFSELGGAQTSILAAPSFDSLELFQDIFDEQLNPYGDGGNVVKAALWDASCEADDSAVPISPSGCTCVPKPTQVLQDHRAQPVALANAHLPTASDDAAATPVSSSATNNAVSDPGGSWQPTQATSADPAFHTLSQYGYAPVHQGCTASMYAQSFPNCVPNPQSAPFVAAMPAMIPMSWQAPSWMAYLPMSLQQQNLSPDQAKHRSQLRKRQMARFRDKKQRLSCVKTVRYASRKVYADARPRVNGRFIRKAAATESIAVT